MSSSSSIDLSKSNASLAFVQAYIILKASLSPADTANPIDAVKRQVNNMLFRYNDSLGGIPMAYTEFKLPAGREYCRIIGEHPWLHLDVLTSVILFKPEISSVLKGKITVVSDSHVSLLVYGLFNASITGDNLRKKYNFNSGLQTWESAIGTLAEGDIITFSVKSIQHSHGVIQIEGIPL